APSVIELAMIQSVPGTRTRSSGFCRPHTNSCPAAGAQSVSERWAKAGTDTKARTAKRASLVILDPPVVYAAHYSRSSRTWHEGGRRRNERRRRRKPAPRRNAERATRRGRSVLARDSRTRAPPHHVYRDAPLDREPTDVVRLGHGVVLALGRDRDALGRHTGVDEDLPHVLRTRRRQRFVVRSIAARIRVPFEHHDDAVHRADQLRDPRETRGGAGIELGLRRAEVDLE